MRPIDTPSPNHNERRGTPVDMLVLHYTGMLSAEAAVQRLCDPAVEVSAHYTIAEDGTVHAHVPEDRRAWQAGPSHWRGRDDVNSRSVGIEIVNTGHEWGLAPFPPAQIAAVIGLSRGILARHCIGPAMVVAHSDIAPRRKEDPGELFPWAQLARAGVGLWPEPDDCGLKPADPAAALAEIGYGVAPYGLVPCVAAFQRRFRPARIDGIVDTETGLRIGRVLRLARASP